MKNLQLDKLEMIKKHILIKFVNDVADGRMMSKHGTGIILTSALREQTYAKWAKVLSVGPQCADFVKVGEWILISPMMWSPGYVVADDTNSKSLTYWKTEEQFVMATSQVEMLEY